jgi:hypothetical protein
VFDEVIGELEYVIGVTEGGPLTKEYTVRFVTLRLGVVNTFDV